MSPYAIPPLVTAILSFFLGLFVLARDSKSKLNLTFGLWCLLTAYWQGCWTILFNSTNSDSAELLARLGYSGIIFIPIVFFHFVIELTGSKEKRALSRLFYALGGVFLIGAWVGDEFVAGTYSYTWGFYPKVGFLHLIYVAFLSLMVVTGLSTLSEYRKDLTGQPNRINQVNYVFFSTIIYSLAGIDFLANYGVALYPMGLFFTNVHAAIIAYAIVQYRFLDIQIIFKRSLIYALILLALMIPCYVIVIAGQEIAFGTINYTFSLVTLLLLIAVGFLFPKFRFKTQDALERALFKKRTDYRETLLRSSKDMVSLVDLETLSNRLVETVARALGIEKVSLFLIDEMKGIFNLQASVGLEFGESKSNVIVRDDALVHALIKSRAPIIKEEIEMAGDTPARRMVSEQMRRLEGEISLPIISKEKVIGLLNLGHKEGKETYSNEDLELLSTLTNQAAIAIENARLYENLKQSQNIIRRADRLSSLGLLTAGLAHEIRNPLVAIRTFTQLLPERYEDAEFRNNFQGLALKEVDRICGLINDLLSFARPSPPNVSEENINENVDGISRILETEAKEKGVQVARHFGANLPKVWIDREQMKQVFMNVILNAIQSIENGGSISISTRLLSTNGAAQAGQFVQVEIRDTGVGISEENLDHIFDPFFTNKKEGSGLGLSISHQIVQEHGGYFDVQSKVGKGTIFSINLPVGRPTRAETTDQPRVHEENPSHR